MGMELVMMPVDIIFCTIKIFSLFPLLIVMRASGSYRLLLNTHLWAQMKCDRANQKSIRITAQTGGDGKISVFLIMVG